MAEEKNRQITDCMDEGPILDERLLKKDRVKFGLGSILFQSEEIGLGGVPTAIVRYLGGNDSHIGIIYSTTALPSITQFLGVFVLRWQQSNRRAMIFAMLLGFILASAVALTIVSHLAPSLGTFSLYGYLILSMLFMAMCGLPWNIESTWIGDLVPKEKLGSFTSIKWILSVIGIIIFTFIIGKICDFSPNAKGYASVYFMFAVSFIIAALIYAKITDRKPQHLNFLSVGKSSHERINYGAKALWCYIIFYCCWAGGRIILLAFMAAFLIDVYHFSMTKLAILYNIQPFINILMLFIFGKVTDKIGGNRIPLMFVSGTVACAMFLWVLTPWLGLPIIIIYQIINGAAGQTHTMLAINLGLEIFPHKGRATYLGFSRIFIGAVGFITPIIAGKFMQSIGDFHGVFLL